MQSFRFRDDPYIIYELHLFVNTFFKSFSKTFFGRPVKVVFKKSYPCPKILFLHRFFDLEKFFSVFEKKIKLFFKNLLTFQKKCV